MAIDAFALNKATTALENPSDYEHVARIQTVKGTAVTCGRSNFYPALSLQPCQPSDQGYLVRISDGKVWRVIGADFDGDSVLHTLEGEAPPAPGDDVICLIDRSRRHFLSRAHSAAVLVSGLAFRHWGGSLTTSCNLSAFGVRLDVSGGSRRDHEVEELLAYANRLIADDGQITSYFISAKEAALVPQFLRSNALQRDFETIGSLARVVRLTSHGHTIEEQYDLGTHVRRLAEIGRLEPLSRTNKPSWENKGHDHFRLRFCPADPWQDD